MQSHDARTIPSFDFYGDTESWPVSELIHGEPLAERSQRHDWRIRPHRHDALTQLFLLLEGSGSATLDSVQLALVAPCLLIVPERCVHEFSWSSSSRGFVLSMAAPLVNRLERLAGAQLDVYGTPNVLELGKDAPYVEMLVRRVNAEAAEKEILQELALESLMQTLTVWLARRETLVPSPGTTNSRAARHYKRFTQLVERHHKQHWSVGDYARTIGITATHLNTITRRAVNRSALRVINERVVLAARRGLAYTDRPVADVAQRLGFSDPSYFARFFKRETGLTPVAFRRRSGTIPGR